MERQTDRAKPTLLHCARAALGPAMETAHAPESFSRLLLRHRARTSLSQRDLAARAGVSRRTVQDWEAGVNFPSAPRLQALIRALLEARGLTKGREIVEVRELWSAVERESRHMHARFDEAWFTALPGARVPPPLVERSRDWGEAPDTMGFVGRHDELALLRSWLLEERCRLVALLGMGGIGKTSVAARLAQDVAPNFERVYWRSLRDAPPVSEWLAGALGFLSDQQLVPPPAESERIAALLHLLRQLRCLLVLDNSETLFEPGQTEARYRAGMVGYGHLLQAVGDASHQSCVVVTSREAPPELVFVTGARELELHGLDVAESQALLGDKELNGDAQAWVNLVNRYGGNGAGLEDRGRDYPSVVRRGHLGFSGIDRRHPRDRVRGYPPPVGCSSGTTLDSRARRPDATGGRARTGHRPRALAGAGPERRW
jgi:transcriptional regulator with XRE-family HTH domain